MKNKCFSLTAVIVSCAACTGEKQAPTDPLATAGASMSSSPPGVSSPQAAHPSSTLTIAPEVPTSTAPSATVAPVGSGVTEQNPPSADGFQFMWEDNFDTLDTTRWAAQTHSWDGNLAQFTRENVTVEDGRLQLALTPSGNAEKPYHGVEYRSREAITYGKVEASIRFARGSGVVSSLVLIYTPWPPDDWNELDIECLGNTTGEVQFNHMVNIPPADPLTEHLQFPEKIDLGFDPTDEFHTYTIEWLPDSVRFLVDGVVVHEPTQEISRLVLPQNILLTIWASDSPGWAGPIDDTTAPTYAEVDWIRVYSYAGE